MRKNNQYVIDHVKKRKTDLISIFHSKCCICGFDKFQEALEFHHVNPKEKAFGIMSGNVVTKSLKKQLQELKKCILVCANCHRGIHYNHISVPEDYWQLYDDKIAQELLDDLQKKSSKQIYYCENCGKIIPTKGAKYCRECSILKSRKTEWPSREELKMLIRKEPFVQIGKKYLVSDKTICRWCNYYNLPSKVSEIKKISDEDWEKI